MSALDISLIVALGVSELLSLIPSFKSNGIMDMVLNVLRGVAKKDPGAA